ncbi:MAG: hypothetical protein JXA67_11430 [Micromonosporaceae bacterium]|nr:hypothetical protein [Micromonosporaceae bacterium]
MRPDVPGVILDAGALRTAKASIYVRTIIRVYSRSDRPIVVPSTALVMACATGHIEAWELDPPEITVTALTQTIAPAVAYLMASVVRPVPIEVAHAAYESSATGYPIVTTDAGAYSGLVIDVDVEQLPN